MAAVLLPWLAAPLAEALRAQRGHALLVRGAEGAGQFEFALALARAWLCETPVAERPQGLACGRCESCHLVSAEQVHPDLCVLLPESLHLKHGFWQKGDDRDTLESGSRKPSEWIKIEQVRGAIDFASQTRSRSRPKVIVIHPAERLQLVAASALLKLLEEPQGGLRLVLTSADAASLMATVRSRCHMLSLPEPDPALATRWLADAGIVEAALLHAASGGQPLAALERHALGLDAGLWRRLPALVAAGQAQPLAKLPLPLVIECLHKLCHDAMCVSAGATPRYFAADSLPATALDLRALADWARALDRIARHSGHPWNAPVLLEALIAQGRRALAGDNVSLHSAG